MEQCIVCLKDEAVYVCNKLQSRELTYKSAAKELDVPLPVLIRHYELHVRKKVMSALAEKPNEIEAIAEEFLDKIKEAKLSLTRLIGTTKDIHEKLTRDGPETNIKLLNVYGQMEKNVLNGIHQLAELEGDIQNSLTINYTQNNLKIDKLVSLVLEQAPEDFKTLVLEKLEKMDTEDVS